MAALTRIALGLIVAIAAATPAGAQAPRHDSTHFTARVGLKGGWAHSTLHGSIPIDAVGLNALAGGGFMSVALTPALALQLEALYVPKGTADEFQGISSSFRLGYLEIPLLARVSAPVPRRFPQPYVLAGPYAAYRTGCSARVSGAGVNTSASCAEATMPVNHADVGLAFGGGLSFPLGRALSGLVEARYDLGLRSLGNGGARNRSFLLLGGVSIPIGRRPCSGGLRCGRKS